VTAEERELVLEAEAARDDVIQVDDYDPDAFRHHIEPPFDVRPPNPDVATTGHRHHA
jgi:hypothetical protein